jgi:nucleoside-diphosphate-sugar epimerase
MKKILLLGGSGYIGSYFREKYSEIYDITNIDLNWFGESKSHKIDFNNLEKDYIEAFDSIILLAGHSSVKMCDGNIIASFNNNVRNFVNILSKINKQQKFIYASSSSVYGHTNSKIVDENYTEFTPNNPYDLTKQIIDMYALQSGKNFYGLRFGTVNGWSPNLRDDIMINAMTVSGLQLGHIKLYIKDILRPILGISDLCRALQFIIDSSEDKPGIYNLASFNSTSEEIANGVSKILQKPVLEYSVNDIEKITNVKLQTKAYNFAIDSSKFCKSYDFKFNETIETITQSILDNFNNCNKTPRNEYKQYE